MLSNISKSLLLLSIYASLAVAQSAGVGGGKERKAGKLVEEMRAGPVLLKLLCKQWEGVCEEVTQCTVSKLKRLYLKETGTSTYMYVNSMLQN